MFIDSPERYNFVGLLYWFSQSWISPPGPSGDLVFSWRKLYQGSSESFISVHFYINLNLSFYLGLLHFFFTYPINASKLSIWHCFTSFAKSLCSPFQTRTVCPREKALGRPSRCRWRLSPETVPRKRRWRQFHGLELEYSPWKGRLAPVKSISLRHAAFFFFLALSCRGHPQRRSHLKHWKMPSVCALIYLFLLF